MLNLTQTKRLKKESHGGEQRPLAKMIDVKMWEVIDADQHLYLLTVIKKKLFRWDELGDWDWHIYTIDTAINIDN